MDDSKVKRLQLLLAVALLLCVILIVGMSVVAWQFVQVRGLADAERRNAEIAMRDAAEREREARMEAEQRLQQARKANELLANTIGDLVPETVGTPARMVALHDMAQGLRAANRLLDSLPVFEELAKAVEKGNYQDKNAALYIRNACTAFDEALQLNQSETWRRKWLLHLRETEGAKSAPIAAAIGDLGNNLLQQQKWQESETTLRECLTLREELFAMKKTGVEAWEIAITKSMIGEALTGLQKYKEAEPLLIAGYEGVLNGTDHLEQLARYERQRETVERLVLFYTASGEGEKAIAWQQKMPVEPAPIPRPGK